jgi:hypothetical protein
MTTYSEEFEFFCASEGYAGEIFKANLWKVWQASRASPVAENEKLIKRIESLTYDRADLRDKIETLRGMLPECKNCEGGGQVNDGFGSFDCWECGGTGCSSST